MSLLTGPPRGGGHGGAQGSRGASSGAGSRGVLAGTRSFAGLALGVAWLGLALVRLGFGWLPLRTWLDFGLISNGFPASVFHSTGF